MQHTVLIADDDASIRDLLLLVLAEKGYATIEADDGRKAVELAVEHHPDVALLDVMMPVMDGFAACRAIKADPRTADIPVLLLTALAHTDSKVRGLDEGATDYITKPFESAELLARLRSVLHEKGRRDELAAEALVDALTSLINRRSLERQLDQLLAHASRVEEPLSALLFDADRFKNVNDTYGHEAGDVVLRTLARRAQEAVRAQDIVGRFGGEEFLVILPSAGPTSAYIAAERLRAHIAATPIAIPAGSIDVTVSVGAATAYPGMDMERGALVTSADMALYNAKRAGRNRVAHADGQPTAPLIMPEAPEPARALLAALALVDEASAKRAGEVAQLCWKIGGALGLSPTERARVALAGQVHNIGALVAARPALAAAQPVLVAAGPSVAEGRNSGSDSGEDWSQVGVVEDLLRHLPSLQAAGALVCAQGERWDGSGGPRGLRGEEIPFGGRILAVAAAYERARRDGPAREVAAAFAAAAGERLDPMIVAVTLRILP